MTFSMTASDINAITSNIVILSLTVNSLGNNRKVAGAETDTDDKVVHMTKKVMEAPEFQALRSLEGEIRRYVQGVSLPSPFKNGTYSMPKGLLMMVDDQLASYQRKQAELVDYLCDALPRIRVEMEAKQQFAIIGGKRVDIWNPQHFPTASKVREAFGVDWGWVQLATPDSLSEINTQLFEREQKKIAKQWAETMADMQDMLRVEMLKLTEAMTERLQDDNGKKKVFRDTLVTNFTDFLQTFDARNITNNSQLTQLAKSARQLLNGVDADDLRKSRGLRRQVQTNFNQMKQQLATMVIDRPTRGIELGD